MQKTYAKKSRAFSLKSIILLLTFPLLGSSLFAQTSFGLGEIAITGYQSSSDDRVSIVFLKDVAENTVFQITDSGWLSSGSFRGNEGPATVTITEALSCGTEVLLEVGTTSLVATGDVTTAGGTVVGNIVGTLALSSSGDQVFIYQSSNAQSMVTEAELITGLHMDGNWEANATNSNTSAKPTVFTDGINSNSISPEINNASFICGDFSGTPTEIAAAINTYVGPSDNPTAPAATWSVSNSVGPMIPAGCTFTCEADVCDDPPSITCPANNFGLPDICNPMLPAGATTFNMTGGPTPSPGLPTVTGGCPPLALTFMDETEDMGCTRTVTRTYRITDNNGDFAECDQTFTFSFDDTRPTFPRPDDQVVNITDPSLCPYPDVVTDLVADPANVNPITPGVPFTMYGMTFNAPTVFSDNCPGPLQLYVHRVRQNFDISGMPCTRVIRIRWRVIDACGNRRTRSQDFTINDMVPPVLSEMPVSTTVECDAIPDAPEITAEDACGGGGVPEILFINEIHYDNSGTDANEFVEIAGTAGTDLSNCTLELYNGANGTLYNSVSLSGSIDDEGNGFGAVEFAIAGIQNGDPDGVALVCDGDVIEFLSYEGSFEAVGGTADGMMSTDIGVDEQPAPDPGLSLQRVTLDATPAGCMSGDFVWTGPTAESPGMINVGQSFNTEACPGMAPIEVIFSENFAAGACPQSGILTRMWIAMDECGNEVSHTQMITVEDNTPPVFNNIPDNAVVDCEVPDPPVVSAVDNCDNGGNLSEVWINEVHYDNVGGDVGEFVEIAGTTGFDLSACQLVAYNGANGTFYSTVNLSGTIDDESFGYGAVSFPIAGLQNGSPDGVALVCGGVVVEFISYEGTFMATNGPANGMMSTNIGTEGSTTPIGQSLQLSGVGATAAAFTWDGPAAESPGMLNSDQQIGSSTITVMFNEVDNVDPCQGGTVVRTWSAMDACGNPVSQTQTILVNAPNGPSITNCPGAVTVTCEEEVMADPDAVLADTDCMFDFEVTVSDPVIDGEPGCDGTTYTFTYTATDGCDRADECMQMITISNSAPDVTVPGDATVACASDIAVSTADMMVVQDCPGELTLSVNGPVIDGAANCPNTTYTYTYRAIDDCGRVVNVNRVFTIGDNDLPTITAPAGYNVTCLAGSAPNPDWATFTTACNNGVDAEVSVSGPVIFGAPDCNGTTYTYTYTVVDACGREASDTQTLTVVNDGAQLICPTPLQVFGCIEGGFNDKIEAWIETVEATSACGVDLPVSNNFNGNAGICLGNNFTTVTFTAFDPCTNQPVSCQGTIAITDTDPPVIYQDPQELLVACNGNTQATFNNWLATQGDAAAIDACWGDQVSWTASVGPNALNCANGPQAIVVIFTVTDGCGNSATTTGIFNTKLLPTTINVNGLIQREDSEPVANVQIGAYLSNGLPVMDMSDVAGDYGFPELEFDEDTEIKPEKNDDPLNGVSTFDLIYLQQHILGINELDSPYKRIAADVNRSGNISTLDLVMLRRLILHIDEEFTDNTSWRFVDADFVFPNPENPFATAFPEIYNVSGQEEEVADFIAVKIGDLNLDSDTYGLLANEAENRDLEDLIFRIEDQELIAGEVYRIEVNAQNFEQINGFQFTLNNESSIEVLDIEAGDLVSFDEQNFNLAKRENGAVPMSWNSDRAQDLSSADVAFSVIIKAREAVQLSEVLSLSSQYTKAEAYQSTELMNVNLIFNENGQIVSTAEFKLFQNTPNPFKDATTIGFQLPEAGEVSLEIYDVSGRLLHSEMGAFAAGYNQFDLDRSDLPSGILYYQVTTADDSDSKKMILMD